MTVHDEALLDQIAALAVGALAHDEARDATAHLAACAECRAEYRNFAAGVDVIAAAAGAGPGMLSTLDAARLKREIVNAGLEARPPAPVRAGGYAGVVPFDAMVDYAPGVRFAVLPAPGMTLVYWVFDLPVGASLPVEQHPNTQAGIVLEGAMTMRFGDGTERRFGTGEVYAVAPGTTHEAQFFGHTVLFDVYTPNREAYEDQYRATVAAG